MKRLFMLLCAVVAFVACEQAPIKEMQGAAINERNLEVSFEGGDDTRIQLQNGKTVWTEGDHVSVFYRSTVNEEWQFMGETGDRIGNIVPVDNTLNPPATHNRVVVIYPYNNEYYLNTETYSIEASLPAVQNYLKDSYGTNGNIMVSSGDYKQVSLKSVCGWLKLQLTGDGEVVKSITLRGNDGEQVAGEIHINTSDATCVLASASGDAGESEVGGTLVRPGTILTEVTLDCGEGVTLGEEATAFYIALPPQTFEKGFTVEIADTKGYVMEQSTDKALTIERNHIQPMAAFEFINPNPPTQPTPASNRIWYTSSDGNIVEPNRTYVFGANIISNKYNNGMGVITFDGDVTSIGNEAFYNCDSLTSVTIPDSVTSIGGAAFKYCDSLTSVTIGDSVTTIGDWAFAHCTSLTSVTIGNSVTTIGGAAFISCDSLTSVNIPDSVTTIGGGAFEYCTSLTEFTGKFASEDGRCLIIDGTLDYFAPYGLNEYTIPDSVTWIGRSAFSNCDSLTSVNIPDSVTWIQEYAFYSCGSLTSVNIPDSVISIGTCAFCECSLTSVNIPDSVTTIGDSAFYYCGSLTSVYCEATTPPSLGDTDVFDSNGSGRKIYVPAGSVNAYKSATLWSEYADAIVGYDFENGEIVEVQPNNEIWYTSSDGNIVTPDNTNAFGAKIISNTYNNGKGVIIFDGDVMTIGKRAFWGCKSLTSVTIGDSVTTIGNYAFYECNRLTSVNIPDSVTTIGEWAFFYCSSLTSVNIPDSVTTIGERAFGNCSSLKKFKGKFATEDGRSLIMDNTIIAYAIASGTTYTIPDSVMTIGNYAFYWSSSLTSVNIPDSVTKIGENAFCYCPSLTSVYCKATTPPVLGNSYVFEENGSSRKIYVPTGSVNAYKSATNWSEYKSAIVGYNF